MEVICQNGHAWLKDLHFPKSRKVHFYEGDIREATWGEPLVVLLLSGQDKSFSVDQFMIQDGRTCRTQESHERLQKVCDVLGDKSIANRRSAKTTGPPGCPKRRTAGSPPRPAFLTTLRRPAWSTVMAAFGTRRATTGGSRQHRHEGLLPSLNPGGRPGQALVRVLRSSNP